MLKTICLDINKQFSGFLYSQSNKNFFIDSGKFSFLQTDNLLINNSFIKDKLITILPNKKNKLENLKKEKFTQLFNSIPIYKNNQPIYNEFYSYKENDDVLYGFSISEIKFLKNKLKINHKALFIGKVKNKTVFFVFDLNRKNNFDIEKYIKKIIQNNSDIVYQFTNINFLENILFSDFIFNIKEFNKIKEMIYNDFPFLKDKKEKNIFKLFWLEICVPLHSLLFNKYNDFVKHAGKYNKTYYLDKLNDLKIEQIHYCNIDKLMSETSKLKQLKQLIYKANKNTIKIFDRKPNKNTLDIHNTFYLSFFNLFDSPEKMNKALELSKPNEFIFYSLKYSFEYEEINSIKEKFINKNIFDDELINLLNDNNKIKYILTDLAYIIHLLIKNKELYNNLNTNSKNKDMISYKKDEYKKFSNKKYRSINNLMTDLIDLNHFLEKNNTLSYYKSVNLKNIENKKFIIKEIEHSLELNLIGKKLANCLDSYKDDIKRKEKSIFYINNKENNNIECCIEYNIFDKTIVQAKRKFNNSIEDEDILNLINEWSILNNIKIDTDDLDSITKKG